MTRPQTFVEHDILVLDADRGITYQSFDDFWEQRMEPMQFIGPDAKGVFAHIRELLRRGAREQFDLFHQHRLTAAEAHLDPDCGSSPQAGELSGRVS